MKRYTWIGLMLLAVALPLAAWAQSEEEIQKIQAAMPDKARVEPKQPRKLLVFNLCKGFVHDAVPVGAKAFEIMGQKTGAFTATLSDDPAVFAPANLAQYDAVMFNNSTGELFEDPAMKQGLLDYVKSGKGLVGVHAGTDCFYQWPEYGEMMGGYFDGHPWGSGDTVTVNIVDPAHPLCAAFGGQNFKVKDEIYQIRDPYSREKLRILLNLDPNGTDMTKKGIKRQDGDFAVSWIRKYGEGRVFYNSLGHNHEIFWTTPILQFYLDGIQFALGDLDADATPTAQLPADYFNAGKSAAQRQAVDDIFKEIGSYQFGDSREKFTALNDIVVASQSDPAFRAEIANKLAALLATDATLDCKQYVCRELYLIGSAEQVPQIAALLTNPETSDMARYALEQMPDPAACKALAEALDKVEGALKVGVINSIGERRSPLSVPALAKLIWDKDPAIAEAAVAALGKIGGDDAAKALKDALAKSEGAMQAALADAYLLCGDLYLEAGNKDAAVAIYNEMYGMTEPKRFKIAGFEGLVKAQGTDAVPMVVAALSSGDAAVQAVAAGAVRGIAGADVTQTLAAELPKLPVPAKVLLVQALADRGDKAALAAVLAEASNADAAVRTAALGALGALGDGSTVAVLTEAAAKSEREERDVVRGALDRLRGADVDSVLAQAAVSGEAAVRCEAIRSLAARNAVSAVPALLESAKDADESVRAASFKALKDLAGPDAFATLLDALVAAKGNDDRKEGEGAVVAVARKTPESVKTLLDVLDKTTDLAADAALIRVLGQLGDNAALDAIRKAAQSTDAAVSDAAIRALTEWPNAEPMADVRAIAGTGATDTYKVLAMRGLLRMLEMPSKRSAAETFELYKDAIGVAQRPEEKRTAIKGLAKVRDKAVVEYLQQFLQDEALKEEAQKSLDEIKSMKYVPSASHGNDQANLAVDGNLDTRWTTGAIMQGGEWFLLDLGWEQKIKKIVLDTQKSGGDYPRGYEVYVATNPVDMGTAVAVGKGTGGITEIAFEPAVKGSFIKIVQTGKHD
ncbi:MAG: hypothetical protein QG656_665, partial [Candidatus Hydrogenedentes bacterium]|nr:hypothetical protein [Candidatus Hydrogenedentota bacterium]